MKLKGFTIALICLSVSVCYSQHTLTGVFRSAEDSTIVKGSTVYLDNEKTSTITDANGKFIFRNVHEGNHTLHVTTPGFKYHSQVLHISADQHVVVYLDSFNETLNEVVVTDLQSNFGFTRMNSVENLGIYEGKKSEVIIPEQLVANLSTNNARQIYSRVAGLNIFENDGAGLQLSVGGRGLDPNRTSNFNVRQNGYDISADALGYPESYYTPPTEAIGRIQIVRGAASLQYGTQFGGLINFNLKTPVIQKKIELVARQTAGSFGFYNAFTSVSGTVKKLSYYSFFQYKRGDGWRKNSEFDNHTFYANINYAISEKTKIGVDITQMGYLAQQPGGLTDEMFEENPRQTNRERNWFTVNWNLFAFHVNHKFSSTSEFNLRVFGLSAYRYSVGFRPYRVATVDDNSERDLIKGDFTNWGTEARYLKRYKIKEVQSVLLVGGRYYHGFNHSTQGVGSTGKGPDFKYVNPETLINYEYEFPNRNASVFLENIFYINDKISITPGLRFEYINTKAEGYYGTIYRDLAGNIIEITRTEESRVNGRHFLLAGIGMSYRPKPSMEMYTNISQNYRSITFSDMRISNPSSAIDPNLQDETGYSFDLGIRSEQTLSFNYDVSIFYLNYDNRIGEIPFSDEFNRPMRMRSNIGQAIIQGIEAYGEVDLIDLLYEGKKWSGVLFGNIALIESEYRKSDNAVVEGNDVEFVPDVNLKTGVRLGYANLKASFQYTFLSQQFADAENTEIKQNSGYAESGVLGIIPSYSILDFSVSYDYKKARIEASINNLANHMYFTRRATGYPGPGIIPSDGRSFFLTLQIKI